MEAMEGTLGQAPLTRKKVLQMILGAIVGAAFGFGFMTLAKHMHVPIKQVTWADLLGFWLGITFFGVGLILYAISFNRKELAKNIEGESAELPATEGEVKAYRLQALTLILAGAMILLVLLGMGSLGSTRTGAIAFFATIAGLFVVQTWANVVVWRQSDEFLRSQMLIACGITFAVFQGALFLWAAAEKLHLARPLSSWDSITALLTIYLATSSWLSLKNRPRC